MLSSIFRRIKASSRHVIKLNPIRLFKFAIYKTILVNAN